MKHEAIETFTHAGRTVSIYVDPEPPNPRENDNLATMACWHRRAKLGDEQISPMTEEEIREHVGNDLLALLPLSLYDHGGMTMSTGSFSCPFDSGQVGWAYVTKTSAEAMGCVGTRYDYQGGANVFCKPAPVGTWDTAALENAIKGEVSGYDDYLTGRCYGYVVSGIDGEEIESCWGFLGSLDYVRGEARSAAEHADDPAIQRQADELQGRATYAGVAP